MAKLTGKKDSPLAVIKESTTVFNLNYMELNSVCGNCNILKDFINTSALNCRKLHKNYKVLSKLIEEINDDGQAIEKRRSDLNQIKDNPDITEAQKKETDELMADLIEETKKFNKAKYDVHLYTMLDTDFPKEREKFGKKDIPQQNGLRQSVEYINSFNELIDTVIKDTLFE